MARPPRLHVPGGFYHVTLRGNHRQRIFFSDGDHVLLDALVAKATEQLGARIHAYCWMTNHLHLLVQVADAPLGRLMLRIASSYARRVQERLETTGHLFERRHHAVLVHADDYLLTLIRYIHLNPVRAGLVSSPSDHAWSSHQVYLGERPCDWVTTRFGLSLLSPDADSAIRRYRELMDGDDPCCWGSGKLVPHRDEPQILGSDDFVARVLARPVPNAARRSLDDVIRESCARARVSAAALASGSRDRHLSVARAWIGHEAVAGGVASICEVARRLDRSEAAIRRLMARHPRQP